MIFEEAEHGYNRIRDRTVVRRMPADTCDKTSMAQCMGKNCTKCLNNVYNVLFASGNIFAESDTAL